MSNRTFDKVRDLSRENLEDLAIRAIIQSRQDKQDRAGHATFVAVLSGFMLGALVAASGFVTGLALN